MRTGLVCLAVTAAIIGAVWAWLGSPVLVAQSPMGAGEKLYCVSYAPFRGSQTPFDPNTRIPAAQIEEDLRQLAAITDCVRIYSADQGLEQVVPIAARLGLKVLQGFWISNNAAKTKIQFDTAADIANRYPETVRAVVVGNEVLLRGDQSAADLIVAIDDQKIVNAEDFLGYIEGKRPGDEVTLTIVRDGRRIQVPLILATSEAVERAE